MSNGIPGLPDPILVQHMLEELSVATRPLTEWEQNFVESISDQIHHGRTLSTKQMQTLERIYKARTA